MSRAQFTAAYIEAALFGIGPDDETSGKTWAPETTDRFTADAHAFYDAHKDDIQCYPEGVEQAGHDLWFTRCGHGCGYWEQAGDPHADRLDAAAKALGNIDLCVGDDGLVYAA